MADAKTPKPISVTIAASNVPQVLFASSVPFAKATLYGIKSYNSTTGLPTNNTGDVNIGFCSVGTPRCPNVIAPGEAIIFQAPESQRWDLKDIVIVGAQDDAVQVVYS